MTLCVRLLEVDTELLSESSTATFSEDQLLSPAYLLPLFAILQPSTRREQSPLYSLFSVLATEYAVNVQLMARHLLSDFLGLPTNGLRRLLDFADAACHKVTPKHTLMSSMTRIINTAGYHVGEAGGTHYYGDVLHYFKSYDALLQVPGNQIDVGATRDLVVWFSTLLNSLCRWDDTIASECAENLLASWRPRAAAGPEDESSSHTLYDDGLADTGILVSTAWKFRLLVKYAKEGRMELRVMSIGFLDNELVGVWRNYHNTTAGDRHPVIQFAADFLLDEKVIDYIISVKSHPQLIQRSGNIVGFLVVSHRYSEQQADAILNVISNTQNLRFVAAALTMLCGIVNLMELRHLVYLCSQLYNLPIESYSPDLLRLLLPLVHEKLGKHVEDLRAGMTRPWNVCIRLIRDTAPSRDSTPLMVDLHREACGQLTKMSESITQEEREHIYRECATYIAERSAKATGALRAIYLLCCYDAEFFQQNPDIVRSILEELCGFVKAENSIGPFGFYPTALDYRLEMLCFLILRAPEAIPKDLYPDIWRHTIGDRALNNNIRDQAWNKLTSIVRRGFNDKRGFNNDFCKQLISICVPRLESQFFTQGLYEFVAAYPFSSAMQAVATEDNSQELVQIPAAELLWQMMMNAPKGTIESSAAELLVRRYLDVDALENATVRDFEHAHVALGEKCVAALLANYRTLRQGSSQEQRAVSEDEMDISLSDTTRKQAELRSGRTIFFMKLLLGKLRSKPEFARCPRPESDVELTEPQGNHGEIIEVTYTSSAGADKKSLFIGTANAVSELETRLHNLTGFTKLKIFFMGRQLNAGDQINRKLEDCGLSRSAHMLVQDSSVGTTHHAIPDTSRGSSVFEATLLEHFDELFACMDSSDEKSAVVSLEYTSTCGLWLT